MFQRGAEFVRVRPPLCSFGLWNEGIVWLGGDVVGRKRSNKGDAASAGSHASSGRRAGGFSELREEAFVYVFARDFLRRPYSRDSDLRGASPAALSSSRLFRVGGDSFLRGRVGRPLFSRVAASIVIVVAPAHLRVISVVEARLEPLELAEKLVFLPCLVLFLSEGMSLAERHPSEVLLGRHVRGRRLGGGLQAGEGPAVLQDELLLRHAVKD